MIKGRVKWFDTTKGYGFIVTDEEDGDILLHANVLRNFGRSSVAEGAGITVEVQATDRGRQAVDILDIDIPEHSKGFGFVNIFADDADIFVHMEVLRMYGLADLQPGEAVCVRIVDGPRGQMAAEVRNWDYAAGVEGDPVPAGEEDY